MGKGNTVTRRAILVAGGVTLLVGYTRQHPPQITGAAHPTPAPAPPPAGPAATPAAGPAATPAGPAATPATGPGRSASTLPARARLARRPLPPKESSNPRPPGSRPAGPRVTAHGRRGDADAPMFYIDDGRKVIALTIDDGPSPVYTPQVLRLLDKYQVIATFSMIGLEVDASPAIVREVAAAGHKIINHTWSHLNLAYQPPVVIADQIDRATSAIHHATGRVPTMFRAPYGAWSPAVLQQCAQTGMTPLAWSVDPRDWSRPGVPSIVGNIMRNTKTGSIILEHDGGGNRSQTVAALKIVLPRLLADGYRFTTP